MTHFFFSTVILHTFSAPASLCFRRDCLFPPGSVFLLSAGHKAAKKAISRMLRHHAPLSASSFEGAGVSKAGRKSWGEFPRCSFLRLRPLSRCSSSCTAAQWAIASVTIHHPPCGRTQRPTPLLSFPLKARRMETPLSLSPTSLS